MRLCTIVGRWTARQPCKEAGSTWACWRLLLRLMYGSVDPRRMATGDYSPIYPTLDPFIRHAVPQSPLPILLSINMLILIVILMGGYAQHHSCCSTRTDSLQVKFWKMCFKYNFDKFKSMSYWKQASLVSFNQSRPLHLSLLIKPSKCIINANVFWLLCS